MITLIELFCNLNEFKYQCKLVFKVSEWIIECIFMKTAGMNIWFTILQKFPLPFKKWNENDLYCNITCLWASFK